MFKNVGKVANVIVCISISVHQSAFSSIPPSICPSHGTWNTMDRFMWHFILWRFCSKIYPENSHLVKIGQKQ